MPPGVFRSVETCQSPLVLVRTLRQSARGSHLSRTSSQRWTAAERRP